MRSTLGVQYTLHMPLNNDTGNTLETVTEGTLALVRVQLDDLLVECPVPGRQRRFNVYDNAANHEIFYSFPGPEPRWERGE